MNGNSDPMTPTDPNERARELKPCPFCNGEARIMLEEEDRPDDSFHNVYCTGCGAQFWVKSKSEAEQKWNRRAQHMPTVDAVEVVRCRDCVHFGECLVTENDYCSNGERKEK